MRLKNLVYRLMGAVCAFAAISCVDDSFDLDNVSTEVTIGSGTTTLPLGYLEKKTIGELLGGEGVDGLVKDDLGNLSFNYSGEGDTLSIDGISTEFDIPEIAKTFDVEYPQFDVEMTPIVIKEEADIEVDLGELEEVLSADIPGVNIDFTNGEFELPQLSEMPKFSGSFSQEFSGDDQHIVMDLPEQINNLSKVIFRDVENGHHGAPMHLSVQFNDLASINGGGSLKFNLDVEGGKFRILNADNSFLYEGSEYSDTYAIEAGAESLDFVIYIESLTNTTELDSNHHLDIPLAMSFDMEFEIETKAGTFSLQNKPHLELTADFEYGDAEIAINPDVNLVECDVDDGEPIEVTGLPAEIKMVNRIAMVQNENAVLKLYAKGLEWLGDYTDDIEVAVMLPKYLQLHTTAGSNCLFDEESGELVATVADLAEGVELSIEALDFGAEGLVPDENGNIYIVFTPSIVARFKDEASICASRLVHKGDLEISVGLEPAHLSMESVSGKIDYSYTVDEKFALEGLKNLNLEIAGIGLKPVIEVSIKHPLTMSAKLAGSIVPSTEGVLNEQNRVEFKDVDITPATYANGVITPAEVVLVIAHESLREQYADEKYTFVPCDVTKLLLGTLPDAFNISLSIGVDSSKVQTIYMADSMAIEYDYKVDVPFAIDNTFEIHYNEEITGLLSTFELLAGYDFSVGDITVIATVVNTTPLEFGAKVTLKDIAGEKTDAQVFIDEKERILGSTDGVTPRESVMHLKLDLGADGRLSKIALVDAIQIELTASSAADATSVPLNDNQYVGVKLQIELSGGITVDLDKLGK